MFHVEFLVDDKHLVKMHLALQGLRIFNLGVAPVVNAKVKGGKAVEANTAPLRAQLLPALHKAFPAKGARITRLQIFEVIRQLGGNPNSQHIKTLVVAKKLKKVGHALYVITGAK